MTRRTRPSEAEMDAVLRRRLGDQLCDELHCVIRIGQMQRQSRRRHVVRMLFSVTAAALVSVADIAGCSANTAVASLPLWPTPWSQWHVV